MNWPVYGPKCPQCGGLIRGHGVLCEYCADDGAVSASASACVPCIAALAGTRVLQDNEAAALATINQLRRHGLGLVLRCLCAKHRAQLATLEGLGQQVRAHTDRGVQ